jgi:exosome complex component RRP46
LIIQSLSPSKLPSTSSSTYSSSYSAPTEIDTSQRTWPPAPSSGDESDEEIVYKPNQGQKAAPTTSIPYSSRASGINATALSILSAGSLALSAIPIAVAVALLSSGNLVLDPTMEEEVKANARFGFGWAISSIGSQGGDMEVDDDEGLEMELVWVESEGSFSRSEVSTNHRPI